MRFIAVRIAWLGTATAVSVATAACAPVENGTVAVARVRVDTVGMVPDIRGETIRVDPEEAAERAVIGGLVGGVLGVGSRHRRIGQSGLRRPRRGVGGGGHRHCHRHRDDAAAAQLHPDRGPGRACHPRVLRHLASGICGAAERVAGAAAASPSGVRNSGQGSRPATIRIRRWPGPGGGRTARFAVTKIRQKAGAARLSRCRLARRLLAGCPERRL